MNLLPRRHTVPLTVIAGGPESTLLASRLANGLTALDTGEFVGIVAEREPSEPVHAARWLAAAALEGERTEDCPCCRCRLDVVAGVRLLVERPHPVTRVLVLVEPERDIATVTQTVLSDPDLQRLVHLDGVVCTVDAVAMATRHAVGLPFARGPELQRLAVADRILVARSDEITTDSLNDVSWSVRSLNRFGPIVAPALTPVDVGALVDLDAWHGAPRTGPARSRRPVILDDTDELPTTVCCELDDLLDPDAINDWFDRLIAEHGPRLLRVQGAVAVVGQEHRVCCHGVRSYATSHSELEHDPERRSRRSVVAVVGTGLDADVLRRDFEAALAT